MRKLIVGVALFVFAIFVFSSMNIRVSHRALAQGRGGRLREIPEEQVRAIEQDRESLRREVNREVEVEGDRAPNDADEFSPMEFESMIQAAEKQLGRHLKGLAEKNEAAPIREAKLFKAMQSYLGEGRLAKVIAELEDIIKSAPGTDEAQKAAEAIESLKTGPSPIPKRDGASDPNPTDDRFPVRDEFNSNNS